MMKQGATKKRMVAKIFGGSSILGSGMRSNSIPRDNIRLARIMLEMEDIPIVEMDTGGQSPRKIVMDIDSGMVFMKKIASRSIIDRVRKEEEEYVASGVEIHCRE